MAKAKGNYQSAEDTVGGKTKQTRENMNFKNATTAEQCDRQATSFSVTNIKLCLGIFLDRRADFRFGLDKTGSR